MTAAEQLDVIVVGGGQAGLAAGHYLADTATRFLILDAASRGGQSWRQRWDSLELFTPAAYSALPGRPFPGDQERYPGKDEVADYLEAYAHQFELPVRHRARVTRLERSSRGYRLRTEQDTLEARQVIVATGAYQNPHLPQLADALSDHVTQLHSAAYRNPDQVPHGTVLVAGSANSGCQIAAELARSRRRVHLSRGQRLPALPHRLLGKSLHWWGDKLGLIAAPLDSPRGRTQRGDLIVGTSPRRLARRDDLELHPRTVAADQSRVRFADNTTLEIDAVIWATGYRSDYSWIHVPVLDQHGTPQHRRGVTESPGLYFLGMHNQHSRGSSLLYWVKDDAQYIAQQVRELHNERQDGRRSAANVRSA
jgi:putative flavoprotein involved in K+ transport